MQTATIAPEARRWAQRLAPYMGGVPLVPAWYRDAPKQREFLNTNEKAALFVGGISSGKSTTGAIRALQAAYGKIGNVTIPTPNVGAVTAPTYRMLADATERVFFEVAGELVKPGDFNRSDRVLRLPNGSEIMFRNTDNPQYRRGTTLAWWWADEAAFSPHSAWKVMLGRLRHRGELGYAWVTTTPKGKNWIYQEFVQAGRFYRTIFTRDNPILSDEYIDAMYTAYHGDYARQELEAAFVAFEGLVYEEFREDVHVQRIDRDWQRVIAGVDWGYAHPGVILVVGLDGDGRAHVLYEEHARQRRIDDWADVAANLREQRGIESFYCDPSEPDYIRKLQNVGLQAVKADNAVLPGIQDVKGRLHVMPDGRPRLTVSPSCVNLIAEFGQYQWQEHKDGIRDAPRKVADHALDALRYAVRAVAEPNEISIVEIY